jgi:hypothetical protein
MLKDSRVLVMLCGCNSTWKMPSHKTMLNVDGDRVVMWGSLNFMCERCGFFPWSIVHPSTISAGEARKNYLTI